MVSIIALLAFGVPAAASPCKPDVCAGTAVSNVIQLLASNAAVATPFCLSLLDIPASTTTVVATSAPVIEYTVTVVDTIYTTSVEVESITGLETVTLSHGESDTLTQYATYTTVEYFTTTITDSSSRTITTVVTSSITTTVTVTTEPPTTSVVVFPRGPLEARTTGAAISNPTPTFLNGVSAWALTDACSCLSLAYPTVTVSTTTSLPAVYVRTLLCPPPSSLSLTPCPRPLKAVASHRARELTSTQSGTTHTSDVDATVVTTSTASTDATSIVDVTSTSTATTVISSAVNSDVTSTTTALTTVDVSTTTSTALYTTTTSTTVAPPAVCTNVVPNSGFSRGIYPWTETDTGGAGWIYTTGCGNPATDYCPEVLVPENSGAASMTFTSPPFSVVAGQTYTLSFQTYLLTYGRDSSFAVTLSPPGNSYGMNPNTVNFGGWQTWTYTFIPTTSGDITVAAKYSTVANEPLTAAFGNVQLVPRC